MTKEQKKAHLDRNPEKKTRRNRIKNKNQGARKMKALVREKLKNNELQHAYLKLKLKMLEKKY